MSFHNRLLGTARVPKKARDELRFSPSSKHVAVQCAGRIFLVNVLGKDGSSILGVDELHRQLRHIISKVPPPDEGMAEQGLGLLTRQDRDVWAGLRAMLEGHSEDNRRNLQDIDSALFVVCLDHEEPMTPTQRSQDLLHGRPGNLGNRWYDKMQVIWRPHFPSLSLSRSQDTEYSC
jgi:carnitine O-acetyltransferase